MFITAMEARLQTTVPDYSSNERRCIEEGRKGRVACITPFLTPGGVERDTFHLVEKGEIKSKI
jgi:hypothetical protein